MLLLFQAEAEVGMVREVNKSLGKTQVREARR